jgi:hypothetical protein
MAPRTKGSTITVPNPDSFIDDESMPEPYSVEFEIEGTRGYLFNRYDVPANGDDSQKGVKVVKTPGMMVHTDSDGNLAARSAQVWNAVKAAGKYRKNPRSARGSLSTVLSEALEVEGLDNRHPDLLTFLSPKGKPYEGWDFEFTSRVKNAGAFAGYVTRLRPALHPGWRLTGRATILLPQYLPIQRLHECFEMAGRFGGIGDGRTGGLGFGRFLIRRFESA